MNKRDTQLREGGLKWGEDEIYPFQKALKGNFKFNLSITEERGNGKKTEGKAEKLLFTASECFVWCEIMRNYGVILILLLGWDFQIENLVFLDIQKTVTIYCEKIFMGEPTFGVYLA